MASYSDYLEAAILNHIHAGKVPFTAPATYLALCTVVPTDASTGSTITEVVYTGYARQQILAAGWNAASGTTPTTSSNASTITFPAVAAAGGTVIAFAVCDAPTGGNVLWWGTVPSVVLSTVQTPPSVAAGALSDTLD